jgi:hypothetical protein
MLSKKQRCSKLQAGVVGVCSLVCCLARGEHAAAAPRAAQARSIGKLVLMSSVVEAAEAAAASSISSSAPRQAPSSISRLEPKAKAPSSKTTPSPDSKSRMITSISLQVCKSLRAHSTSSLVQAAWRAERGGPVFKTADSASQVGLTSRRKLIRSLAPRHLRFSTLAWNASEGELEPTCPAASEKIYNKILELLRDTAACPFRLAQRTYARGWSLDWHLQRTPNQGRIVLQRSIGDKPELRSVSFNQSSSSPCDQRNQTRLPLDWRRTRTVRLNLDLAPAAP